jgi:fructose-1,6-bisphosphatase/inositol monophosphatase family enzyme
LQEKKMMDSFEETTSREALKEEIKKAGLALDHALEVAQATVAGSRELIFDYLAKGFEVKLKHNQTFVTEVDVAVEKLIRQRLEDAFASHRVIGEELPDKTAESDFEWLIDPIDGTHSFRFGVPLYGTLLALCFRRQPILGVIDLPGLDRCYSGALGCGVRMNTRAVSLQAQSEPEDLSKEIIAVGERNQFTQVGEEAFFDRLMQSHGHVRVYSDCFGHAMVLEGAVGAMVDYHLHRYDYLASQILMQEAGGVFKAAESRDIETGERVYNVVMGHPVVVAAVESIMPVAD